MWIARCLSQQLSAVFECRVLAQNEQDRSMRSVLLTLLITTAGMDCGPPLCAQQSAGAQVPSAVRIRTEAVRPGKIHEALESTQAPLGPWKLIVLHHSATAGGSVAAIDAEHRSRVDGQGRPWRGIGYHFVIGNGQGMPDGAVEATFRWQEQLEGAHAGQADYNRHGIGICLIGNFELLAPTAAQLTSLKELLEHLRAELGITTEQIVRHGDLKATACPGKLFSMKHLLSTTNKDSVREAGSWQGLTDVATMPVSSGEFREGDDAVPRSNEVDRGRNHRTGASRVHLP